jgi:hypothetical protein
LYINIIRLFGSFNVILGFYVILGQFLCSIGKITWIGIIGIIVEITCIVIFVIIWSNIMDLIVGLVILYNFFELITFDLFVFDGFNKSLLLF